MISINNGELQGHQLHLKMVSRRIILSQESRRKHYLKRRVKFQRVQQKGGTKEEQWKVKKKYYFRIKGDRRKSRQPKTIYFDCWARLTEIWHVVLNLLQGCKRKNSELLVGLMSLGKIREYIEEKKQETIQNSLRQASFLYDFLRFVFFLEPCADWHQSLPLSSPSRTQGILHYCLYLVLN